MKPIYSRKHFAVRHAASKDETRYNLCGVYFDSDGSTVATDGHMLLRTVRVEQHSAGDFPSVEGFETSDGELEPFILPMGAVDIIRKALPKKSTTLPILDCAALAREEANGNGQVRFAVTDLEQTQTPQARKIEADFPKYSPVTPDDDDKPTYTVTINATLLERLLKAAKEFGSDRRDQPLKIELWAEPDDVISKPLRITHHTCDGDLEALIMPMRR